METTTKTENVEATKTERKTSKLACLKQLATTIRNLVEIKGTTAEELAVLNRLRERLRKEVIGDL